MSDAATTYWQNPGSPQDASQGATGSALPETHDDSVFLLNGDLSEGVGNTGPSFIAGRGENLFTGAIFASNAEVPSLQFPEGLTSWNGHVFVGTYNIDNPNSSRILVFDAKTGELEQTIGDKPGQELVSAGALLGLSINPATGDLYANANQAGYVLRIQNPASDHPDISIYSKYPTDAEFPPGPEDMAWSNNGWLYDSDSNNSRLYAIPPGGGDPVLMFGPPGSGAKFSDQGLFAQHVPGGGLAPNGLVFSKDFQTLYAANTDTDSVIAMPMGADGMPTGEIRTLAQNLNDDYIQDPKGFEELRFPDTRIGATAGTPLNGPDGLALDSAGRIWVADAFGDNLTILDPQNGRIEGTIGSSAVTQGGLLNAPASLTFVGDRIFATNLGLFGPPWSVADFKVGVTGAGGNGNY
ncbi:MAG: SMP-30/gluconolactonase/LRE family protein [Acetobacteraceae bacterium]|nr:SMP-30/gluconolactonase/LRE family protein [Acetobacteraceae bacterium]MBV8615096.1 SMP-30/gluconolactonase/LRE family protein [Acetobacteraceae bacterium]